MAEVDGWSGFLPWVEGLEQGVSKQMEGRASKYICASHSQVTYNLSHTHSQVPTEAMEARDE